MKKILLKNATAAIAGDADFLEDRRPDRTYMATVTGTGAVTATVVIEGTNEEPPENYITIGAITLSGTTSASDGFASNQAWGRVRARVTSITGTNVAVTVTMGA